MHARIRTVLAAVLFGLASLATPALAQNTGFHLGLGFGKSDTKDACDGAAAFGVMCDDSDTANKLFAGYRLNRNLALEAGYADLGRVRFSGPGGSIDFESSGVEIMGVGIAPLGPRFWLYAKAGIFFWDLDVSAVGLSESGTELTYGLGAGFDFTQNFSGRIEYQIYPDIGDDFTTGTTDISVLGANLILRF